MPVRDAQATQWGEEEKRAARYQAAMHVCLMQCVSITELLWPQAQRKVRRHWRGRVPLCLAAFGSN